jgi:hypothetical protein
MNETIGAKALPSQIDKIKAGTRERLVSDEITSNLFLLISPKGKKSWRWTSKIAGKTVKVSLGNWPKIPLSNAREAARELNNRKSHGLVVSQAVVVSKEVPGDTFEDVADRFIANKVAANRARASIHEYRRQLKADINPAIGAIPIKLIGRTDITRIVDGMRQRGAVVASNRVAGCSNRFSNGR